MTLLYGFIQDHRQHFATEALCQVLQVSRSCFYAWAGKETYQPKPGYEQKEDALKAAFKRHKRRYGVRRLVPELLEEGVKVSHHSARKIMHKWDLKAIQPRSFIPRTTDSRHPYRISPNLLVEEPAPLYLNKVWVGDLTYIPLWDSGWAYLAVWMDLCSRRIVGWSLQPHMREELVMDALKKALYTRSPAAGLILHSDRGGQYAGNGFREMLERPVKIEQSMSRADNPYDNAYMESCFSRFKAELLQGGVFDSIDDAQTEIFEYIEMYYNPIRRHSALDYKSPVKFEKEHLSSLPG
jgi:transposase InsO family protein